ncbi:hypothetical protein EVB41_059 [Rhizobium phage RHph_TM3_14A]|nr:hypothetical protein EVB29_059 [Rhizobium phage RHph_TM27A]QIG66979.1 hypothetical protein EVB30_059 [Rhizobium phage RHph_TM27B]QIG67068.1 hypothetical protein EVB31_058 [Rhizobium phage RHph_TM29]QIG67524.1 hypothetical protein EVB41_059 [Rhizobium phage RHph_TM3_14A]
MDLPPARIDNNSAAQLANLIAEMAIQLDVSADMMQRKDKAISELLDKIVTLEGNDA